VLANSEYIFRVDIVIKKSSLSVPLSEDKTKLPCYRKELSLKTRSGFDYMQQIMHFSFFERLESAPVRNQN
jgi:hypothetical protein